MKEILDWYTEKELSSDDLLLQRAERAGARLAKYLEWLAHEKERVAQGRLQMLRYKCTTIIIHHPSFYNFNLISLICIYVSIYLYVMFIFLTLNQRR
jgi:hypothetical protein